MCSKKYYPDTNSNPDFAQITNEILDFWKRESVFEKSVDNRPEEKGNFVFFDGPPFANGMPHYGHLLTGFIKDIVARYQTLKGKKVKRIFGWDCHGLPVEMQSEKELGVSGRSQIIEYGIDKFNEHCRKSVLQYTNEWEDYVTKQARWVDFKNSYKTMDRDYMESILWVFKQLYDKGLIYQSERVMPYSWACQTPLSNFETRMDNAYRKKTDKAVSVKFTLKTKPKSVAYLDCKKISVIAWTTTPWTLPSNLLLAVGKEIKYSCVTLGDECIILATNSLAKYKKELLLEGDGSEENYPILTGEDLDNIEYEPLFDYFKDHPNSFKIVVADFVEEGEGTGIVHIAPGFGEDDQLLCKNHNIDLVCPVDDAGKFTEEIYDLVGLQVFDSNDKIIKKLKEQSNWLKTEQYIHNYPHCWRTDTPLIYKAVPSWYVKVTAIKDKLIANNEKINWIPDHIKYGLFGKWLENVKDWSISRNRFWGTPIPIWISDNPKYPRIDVYGSIEELERDFKVKVEDLHRPYIDNLTRPNPNDPTGKSTMKRVADVFDCWFDSGSMPYGQIHYPFANKKFFDDNSSADFIVEYTAQTRGWFYTLTVLSVALFDRPAFLNCICHGVILDEKGEKLSKRLRNYIDPMEVFNKYGSDPLRFYMASSSVLYGQELHLDKEGQAITDTVRLVLKPIWNSYNFFTLYANSDGIKAKIVNDSENINDKYILSKLRFTVSKIDHYLSNYDLPNACHVITSFFEILNNWYIRRNRSRFWKEEKDHDKQQAYDTLYTVLCNISKAASPLLPITFEYIYISLVANGEFKADASVHLTDYPAVDLMPYYTDLVSDIDLVRDICNAALNIRNTTNIRIRQPLLSLTIVGNNLEGRLNKYFDLIKDEINVKKILISTEIAKYSKYNLKINFKLVSQRLAHKMKQLVVAAKEGSWVQSENKNIIICDEELMGDEFSLTLEPIGNNPVSSFGNGIGLVMLDTEISTELKYEGFARDFIRIIQQARKKANFHVSDRIIVEVEAEDTLVKAIQTNEKYIVEQILATQVCYKKLDKDYLFIEQNNIDNKSLKIGFSKS